MIFNKKTKIYIAGHSGMVGSATLRMLNHYGFSNLITITSANLDLTNQALVSKFFEKEKPEVVIFCAAKVGGIQANIDNPATFLIANLQMQNNVIESSLNNDVKKFVFLASSCIYPKDCPQPMGEEYLLTGKLEPTNEGYALAKITGIKILEYYKKQYNFNSLSLIPCNLYGPNDSFDLKNSHVLSALVKKFVDAIVKNDEAITLWGTGTARREFMHVDDLAQAIIFLLENYNDSRYINIGTGYDISILKLSELIADKLCFKGEITWDKSKPDGMLRKCMNVRRMKDLGFIPKITLENGVEQMINIYKSEKGKI